MANGRLHAMRPFFAPGEPRFHEEDASRPGFTSTECGRCFSRQAFAFTGEMLFAAEATFLGCGIRRRAKTRLHAGEISFAAGPAFTESVCFLPPSLAFHVLAMHFAAGAHLYGVWPFFAGEPRRHDERFRSRPKFLAFEVLHIPSAAVVALRERGIWAPRVGRAFGGEPRTS